MNDLIQVSDLTKTYGARRGINDVSFTVGECEVFGFLGPNGAGKTTTIRILMGLLRPTTGAARIGGLDCWNESTAVKRLVGYQPGEYAFDPSMKGAQIIEYLANLRGGVDQGYVRRLVERLDFDPGKKFREYSRGNKQKIGLVQAFMHRPRLLILDEPTGGLDPLNQQEFYKMVAEARAAGQTIFLSSHILPEVEHTCDRVGIIREGRLVQVNEVTKLKELRQSEVQINFPGPASQAWFANIPSITKATTVNGGMAVHLTVTGDLREIIQIAAAHGATNIVTHEPSLEEVFLRFYEQEREPALVH